ncbi:MAG: MBL fold metallo-hydrolase [Nitrososphaerota archaeon]|nr:MBL fold metallo-hydrolase [Candidatus Bathyarchaeota archaeon]MDW8023986.1 MBL fold metallo-hydrolase [Nitrososphaerota archaeon]
MAPYEIIFLGTGGGRFTTVTQKRRTAGIRIMGEGLNLHLDPGPGALVYSVSEGLDPQKINAVFVSHCHPDHYTDAEVLIEAMTSGMTRKRGVLAASKSVLSGSSVCEPSISKYHQQMPEKVIEAKLNMKFQVANINVASTEARHTDPDAVGFRFETKEYGDFAYTSDTEYFEGIGKHYEGVRLLMLCVMRPAGKPWKGHMTTTDAIKIVKEARPEKAVLTHLGMQMIFHGPANEAKLIEEKTGIPTIAAQDGMRISFAEKIEVKAAKTQQGLDKFF